MANRSNGGSGGSKPPRSRASPRMPRGLSPVSDDVVNAPDGPDTSSRTPEPEPQQHQQPPSDTTTAATGDTATPTVSTPEAPTGRSEAPPIIPPRPGAGASGGVPIAGSGESSSGALGGSSANTASTWRGPYGEEARYRAASHGPQNVNTRFLRRSTAFTKWVALAAGAAIAYSQFELWRMGRDEYGESAVDAVTASNLARRGSPPPSPLLSTGRRPHHDRPQSAQPSASAPAPAPVSALAPMPLLRHELDTEAAQLSIA